MPKNSLNVSLHPCLI